MVGGIFLMDRPLGFVFVGGKIMRKVIPMAATPGLIAGIYIFIASFFGLTSANSEASSAPIGAAVQAWRYDPQSNAVTVRIANISDKNITAFNVSITETFADQSVTHHETLVDMLGAVILVREVKGTPDEDRILRKYGDGTLAAHQSRDQVFNYSSGEVVTEFQAAIDVVAYADGTARSTNAPALARLEEHRNAELHTQQKANQILKEVLADSTIHNPADAATARLEKFVAAWNAQTHFNVDIEPEVIKAVVNDLKRAPNTAAAQQLGEEEFLQRYAAEKDQRIGILSKHTQLRTGSANENH
jgi:hypothetical protein